MADCLEVALDNLRLGRIDSLQGTGFMDTPIDAVRRNIQISQETLNDHTILAIWAVFERVLIAGVGVRSPQNTGHIPIRFQQGVIGQD